MNSSTIPTGSDGLREQLELDSRQNEARLEGLLRIAQFESPNEQGLLDNALAEAISLTDSTIGYLYHYDEATRRFTLNTWSKEVMKACAVAQAQTQYDLDKTGLWGEAVRQGVPIMVNDFSAPNPFSKGLPAGHAPLYRFLTIPIGRSGKIVAVIGVANKPRDYDNADVRQLTLMMDVVWKIVERRRFERDLQTSAQKFNLAVQAVQMGVWNLDIQTGKRTFDTQVCRLLGITPDTFVGTAEEFFAAVHPDDRSKISTFLQRTIQDGSPYEVEYRAVWPDGSVHDICARGALARDEQGRPLRLDGVIWDITERKHAQEALQESEAHFKQLAEVFPETIFEADLSGKITYANEHGLRTYGVTQDELQRGVYLPELIVPEDRSKVLQRVRERIDDKAGGFLEFRAQRRNGEVFDALAYSSSMRQRGLVVGIRGFILDISERKQAERELQQANRLLEAATARANELATRAEQANVAKSEFLANMSHEIRTPLNGVIGMTGLLLDTRLSDEQRRYVETVRVSGESLLTLIGDILDFSKIEAGKLTLECLDFDLRSLLDDFVRMMAGHAEEKHIKLVCSLAPDVPPWLRGDPGRLRQVLVNLTGNALKFTSQGEVVVQVSVGRETAQEIVLHCSVRDTGVGIPADRLGLLFQKFTQVDASTTRRYGGTGLGLAISKQLAALMGGEIGVQSVEGRGSEFWFTARFDKRPPMPIAPRSLPADCLEMVLGQSVKKDAPRSLEPSTVAPERFGMPSRVLLVEDNITNQQVALGTLCKLGFPADVVANGREAVEALRKIPYELVFMDIQMPEMDGLSATHAIRAGDDGIINPGLPIIAMTARAMQTDREECLRAGMNDYIAKPVTAEALAKLLAKWLPRPNPAEATGSADVSLPIEGICADAAIPIFCRSTLLNRLMGDHDLEKVIVHSFVQDIPKQITALTNQVEAGNARGAEHIAHTIKGAAAAVSGERLVRIAFALEQAGKAGHLDKVRAGLGDLHRQFEQLKTALETSVLLGASQT